jgi:HK97 family phage portal protein
MSLWDRLLGREQRAAPPVATITPSASYDDWLSFLGIAPGSVPLPAVTVESALEVPAFSGATGFLSRTLASLPLQAFRSAEGEAVKLDNELAMLLNEAPNPDWSSFEWRRYIWHQIFTRGRGPTYIERDGVRPVALWPMDPTLTTVARVGGRKVYRFQGLEYPASDVIDVPFLLRPDQIGVYSPVMLGRKAIGLALAMNDFAGGFFGSGGVPPLALEGPLPQGPDGFRRAQEDIQRAIELAAKSGKSFFGMPPGHKLSPVGIDPDKGQMTEARLFQIQEIARIYGLPPVFVQDLSRGTFSNTEQQDLQLVKHTIGQWAKAFEDELNLKLFGQRRRSRYVRHNLDGLQRGDFKARIDALARGIQTAQITPNEARRLEERPDIAGGDGLFIQGATVPIEMAGKVPAKGTANENGDKADGGDQTAN